jgi:hypothetical protein
MSKHQTQLEKDFSRFWSALPRETLDAIAALTPRGKAPPHRLCLLRAIVQRAYYMGSLDTLRRIES